MHWTDIRIRRHGEIVILEPHGCLTLSDDDESRLMPVVRRLLDEGHRHLLLNLRHLSQIDSTGVGEIVGIYTRVTRMGGQVKLCEVPARVQEILEATRLDAVLQSLGSEADALARMTSG